MKRYDHNYSVYYRSPDEDYPEGAAVDSTSEDNLDGTPFRADFMNDVIGFFQAAFHKAFGNPFKGDCEPVREVSNKPETARKSDVLDALETLSGNRVAAEREGRELADAEEARARSEADKELRAVIDGLLLRAHPVGSYYWSDFPTEPAVLFGGGTWERVKGRFILAAGGGYGAGAEGGLAEVTLTEQNLPSHSHTCGLTNTNHYHEIDVGTVAGTNGEDWTHRHTILAGKLQEGISHVYVRSTVASNKTVKDSDYFDTATYGGTKPYLGDTNLQHTHDASCGYMSPAKKSSHSHSIGYTGEGTPVGIMPPFRAAYCWRRTA